MPNISPNKRFPVDPIGKFIGGAMGLVFAGIGLTVLVFMWGSSFNEFGSPPLFFRVFASFIAVGFVIVGGGMFLGIVLGARTLDAMMKSTSEGVRQEESNPEASDANISSVYACTHCGAPLADGAEVSPHGDVKCTYCNAWFNIHRTA